MAHQCTACGRTFEDGSTAMLSGCPDCGGNTFQYFKGEPPESPGRPPEPEIDAGVGGTVGETVGKARAAVSGLMGDGYESPTQESAPDDDILVADETPVSDHPDGGITEAPDTHTEDTGGTPTPDTPTRDTTATDEPATGSDAQQDEAVEEPSLDELRAELNDQFESIKILEPGQYELNLMELYEREEHIIALQEDGRYVIDVPGTGQFADN
jgi:predicted  nucleic acid-binding Zn-ribbon protein